MYRNAKENNKSVSLDFGLKIWRNGDDAIIKEWLRELFMYTVSKYKALIQKNQLITQAKYFTV